MQNFKEKFKDKKITVMGLGTLGRGLGATKFLAECGAILTVTDLKSSIALKSSLKELRNYKNIKYVLGKHRLIDFRNKDMILKSAGVPLNSVYIKEAQKNKIPIEMDVSLFAKIAPEVMIVGITGTRGKSMTTALIYEILKKNEKYLKFPSTLLGTKKPSVFLGGNVRGVSTLPLLKICKAGDILVCELDSWQLQGFACQPSRIGSRRACQPSRIGSRLGEAGFSPHISVFTSFMSDHMNYYGSTGSPQVGSAMLTTGQAMKQYFNDKANIFKYQNKKDYLIVRPHVKKLIRKNIKSKLIIADIKETKGFKFIVPGEHQKENLACAVEVAKLFNIPISRIKNAVKNFKGLEGRLQYIKTIKGVKIYNDNNATTPEATIAGIKALYQAGKEGKVILICGGADKNLGLSLFVNIVNTFCKAVVFIPGTGTDKLIKNYKLRITNKKVKDLNKAVKEAISQSKKSDIVLFSPAFASFGQFNNEYERNDLFLKIVKKLE